MRLLFSFVYNFVYKRNSRRVFLRGGRGEVILYVSYKLEKVEINMMYKYIYSFVFVEFFDLVKLFVYWELKWKENKILEIFKDCILYFFVSL